MYIYIYMSYGLNLGWGALRGGWIGAFKGLYPTSSKRQWSMQPNFIRKAFQTSQIEST